MPARDRDGHPFALLNALKNLIGLTRLPRSVQPTEAANPVNTVTSNTFALAVASSGRWD